MNIVAYLDNLHADGLVVDQIRSNLPSPGNLPAGVAFIHDPDLETGTEFYAGQALVARVLHLQAD